MDLYFEPGFKAFTNMFVICLLAVAFGSGMIGMICMKIIKKSYGTAMASSMESDIIDSLLPQTASCLVVSLVFALLGYFLVGFKAIETVQGEIQYDTIERYINNTVKLDTLATGDVFLMFQSRKGEWHIQHERAKDSK